MRISELSERTGVPVATVKYYLREGLLPAGRSTGATRAEYDEAHVERLRLVRALVGVAGLSLAAVRAVVDAVDRPSDSVLEALAAAHETLPPVAPPGVDTRAAEAVVAELGWHVDPACTALRQLAVAVASLEAVGAASDTALLAGYGRALAPLAQAEVASVPTDSPGAAARYVVVGTVVYEPVILALRRLAHQDASVRRFGADPQEAAAGPGKG